MTGPQIDPDQPGFGGEPDGTPVAGVEEQFDYFGFSDQHNWYMPDGKSYMVIEVMNEGAKAEFQKNTQRDVTLARGSGDAKFSVDPAEERHQLILTSVVDWNLKRNGQPVSLRQAGRGNRDKTNLKDWLNLTNPALVEDLEKFIRKLNPWLIGEVTVEDIDRQIKELEEQKVELIKRESGEGYSSSK